MVRSSTGIGGQMVKTGMKLCLNKQKKTKLISVDVELLEKEKR